jgi:hypothetical protein
VKYFGVILLKYLQLIGKNPIFVLKYYKMSIKRKAKEYAEIPLSRHMVLEMLEEYKHLKNHVP